MIYVRCYLKSKAIVCWSEVIEIGVHGFAFQGSKLEFSIKRMTMLNWIWVEWNLVFSDEWMIGKLKSGQACIHGYWIEISRINTLLCESEQGIRKHVKNELDIKKLYFALGGELDKDFIRALIE